MSSSKYSKLCNYTTLDAAHIIVVPISMWVGAGNNSDPGYCNTLCPSHSYNNQTGVLSIDGLHCTGGPTGYVDYDTIVTLIDLYVYH